MKIFKAICASILATAMAFSPTLKANAIEKNIEVDENTYKITATASDLGQLNYIMWSRDRYRCEIEGGTYIQEFHDLCYDYVTVFLDEDSTEVSVKLIPTGRFRENTEVVVFGEYYLMAETPVNHVTTIGDINLDGRNNIADAVLLQRYLLGMDELSLLEYNRADLYRDGLVDAFDMVLMRQKIIKNMET